jgi:hypothetical protein
VWSCGPEYAGILIHAWLIRQVAVGELRWHQHPDPTGNVRCSHDCMLPCGWLCLWVCSGPGLQVDICCTHASELPSPHAEDTHTLVLPPTKVTTEEHVWGKEVGCGYGSMAGSAVD